MAGITAGSWLQPCINNMNLEGVERGDGEITPPHLPKKKKNERRADQDKKRNIRHTRRRRFEKNYFTEGNSAQF